MIVVIIDKTYADSNKADADFGAIRGMFPPSYPMQVREADYPNIGQAQSDNPGKTVMLKNAFENMMNGLRNTHKDKIELFRLKHREIHLREGGL